MNKGYNKFSTNKLTEFRRPPQVKSSKAQILTKFHKIPEIQFEDHPIFGHHLILLLLIVHLILGFRRLREIKYYRDDPMVLRLMGMKSLPDVSTISRNLSQLDDKSVKNIQNLSRSFVIDGLHREQFRRVTLDFDGSVLSTRGHAQGSAVGFNKSKKGARSYYPLFAPLPKPDSFSICIIVPEMFMIQMVQPISCSNVLSTSNHTFQGQYWNHVWMERFSTRRLFR
jgi:hypothetical protein